MSEHHPDPPSTDRPDRDDEGTVEFLIGPQDHPDGTPVKYTPEDMRRLKAVSYWLTLFAKKHGLDIHDVIDTDPSKVKDSARSAEIRQAANPAMADAAASVRTAKSKITITLPDGTKIEQEHKHLEMDAVFRLGNAVKALAGWITKPFKWSGRIAVRFGKWLHASVIASSAKSDEDTPT